MKNIRLLSLTLSLIVWLSACSSTPTPSSPPETNSEAVEVLSIASTSSTGVSIRFATTMAESAAVKENYDITATSAQGQISRLNIVAATLSDDATQVNLETLTQSQLNYSVKISNLTSEDGVALNSTQNNTFVGTAGTGSGADSDGDGLSDAQEQNGWTIKIINGDLSVDEYQESSDPNLADTDNDGVSDADEFANALDPRKGDSDADGLTDDQELSLFNTDAANRDTDKDGLSDGEEINTHKTSALLADTDGDQFSDSKEINTSGFNPRLAELPQPQIDIGQVKLDLDIRFETSSGSASVKEESKTASTVLEEGQTNVRGTSDSDTDEFFAEASATAGFEVGITDASVSGSFTVSGGLSGSNTFSISNESAQSSSKAFEDSLTTSLVSEVNESITRTVEAARMSVEISIQNVTNLPFALSDLEITAFYQDPTNPLKLRPLGTLVSSDKQSIVLGGLQTKSGFIFQNDEIFASEVEGLMKNPQGIIFKVANFSIKNEDGRDFGFISGSDVNQQTAPLYIDYGLAGEGRFDRNRVATFDAATNSGGITVAQALEDVLGLKHFDEDANPSSSLSASEQQSSYSTRTINGTEAIWRIRSIARDAQVNAKQEWVVLLASGIDRDINIREFKLEPLAPGATSITNGVTLAFVQDLDKDGVPDRKEYAMGSSFLPDSGVDNLDSDGDGVTCNSPSNPNKTLSSDACETFVSRIINVTTVSGDDSSATPTVRTVRSSPARSDSDNDGLSDSEEKALGTDPSSSDTDGDRVFDKEEADGFANPNDIDTDNDAIIDGDEKALKSNPRLADADAFTDSDNDGLTDREETAGWQVSIVTCSSSPNQCFKRTFPSITVKSDPNLADTDKDGLFDFEEKNGCDDADNQSPWQCDSILGEGKSTHPKQKDTDKDGYEDGDSRDPNPTNPDSDGDSLSDFFEQEIGWSVVINGRRTTEKSNPNEVDSDGDLLNDNLEFQQQSNPNEVDSDGDGATDKIEYNRRSDSRSDNNTSLTEKDQVITVTYKQLEIQDDCDAGFVNGEWNWNLKIKLPNGETVFMRDEIGVEVEVDETRTIDLTDATLNDARFGKINPITFVKKHEESFNLEGDVHERDSGGTKDTRSIFTINEFTPGALFTGVLTSRNFELSKGGSCNSIVRGSVTVSN